MQVESHVRSIWWSCDDQVALEKTWRQYGAQIASRGPGAVAVQRQCDVDIPAQRVPDCRPLLFTPDERLPRVQMLRFVEVAAGDIRVMLEAGHREEVVAIGRFPHVDQIG